MPSLSDIHKFFYLVCLDREYDEIKISKAPNANKLYVDATIGAHHNNYWGPNTTALMIAAEHGRFFAIGYLLNCGANASLKNHEGKTALNIAMTSPGNLGAYAKIGRHGRDKICTLLARNTVLDMRDAYDAIYYAAQKELNSTFTALLNNHPKLVAKLQNLFKNNNYKYKHKNKHLTESELKFCILDTPPMRVYKELDSNRAKQSCSKPLLKFG